MSFGRTIVNFNILVGSYHNFQPSIYVRKCHANKEKLDVAGADRFILVNEEIIKKKIIIKIKILILIPSAILIALIKKHLVYISLFLWVRWVLNRLYFVVLNSSLSILRINLCFILSFYSATFLFSSLFSYNFPIFQLTTPMLVCITNYLYILRGVATGKKSHKKHVF